MLKHLRNEFPEILDEMRKSGDLPADLSKRLLEVLTNFKAQYATRLGENRKP
jgi:hypothetical protein